MGWGRFDRSNDYVLKMFTSSCKLSLIVEISGSGIDTYTNISSVNGFGKRKITFNSETTKLHDAFHTGTYHCIYTITIYGYNCFWTDWHQQL